METKLTVIDKPAELISLISYLEDKNVVAFDTETTGVLKGSEIIGYSVCCEEGEAFYVVLAKWENGNMSYTGLYDLSKTLMISLSNNKLIMHNGIFDCMVVENFFKVELIHSLHTDTMVLAHLLNENRRVGLKELSKEYFGEDATQQQKDMKESVLANGGKLTKTTYEMYKANWQLMATYGAKDALLTYKLFLQLVPELYEQGLDKFFYDEESMPLLRGPTYELNSTGLKVDVTALTVLKKNLEAECLEAKSFIQKEIYNSVNDKYPGTNKKNTFNIGSGQQLSWLLFGRLGLEFNILTKGGKNVCKDKLGLRVPYSFKAKKEFIHACETSLNPKLSNPFKFIAVDNKTLQMYSKKYKWIEKLLEYKKKLKLLNTYVQGIEERIQYGVIYPSFLQHGTTSGRYSSRNPNFQNLPRDDKRIKGCIVSRPNRQFVAADYSQLEPRVFAYFSGDERLRKAFDGTSDFYSVIGMEIFNKTDCTPQKDGSPEAFGIKYKKLRDLSKVIALASTYGATAQKLSGTTGKSIEDTALDIQNYFDSFPGVKNMMLNSHKEAKTKGRVINLFGRPRRMPEAMKITKLYGNVPHEELPYDIRNTLNLAVNHVIQSTGASIVNRAAIRFNTLCKQENIDCKLVLQVHDSLVVECHKNQADFVADLLQGCMENTIELPGVKLEAVPKIGTNLGEI